MKCIFIYIVRIKKNNVMNRATFFSRLGIITGMGLGAPALVTATNLPSESIPFKLIDNPKKGFEPIFYKTPWGQKVIYDRFTYGDMKKAEWIKKGIKWSEIEKLQKELDEKFDSNEIKFTQGPAKLVSGVWQLVLDGQQNSFLIETETGLILVDPGMESNTEMIVKQIEILGYKQSDVKHILLTHCHVDHSHSANYWQKETGAKIHIHQLGKNPIKTGNEVTA